MIFDADTHLPPTPKGGNSNNLYVYKPYIRAKSRAPGPALCFYGRRIWYNSKAGERR